MIGFIRENWRDLLMIGAVGAGWILSTVLAL